MSFAARDDVRVLPCALSECASPPDEGWALVNDDEAFFSFDAQMCSMCWPVSEDALLEQRLDEARTNGARNARAQGLVDA